MLGNHLHLRLSLRRSFIDLVDQGPKSEGSEVIATRANLPIKTAFKTRSGMSPQNSLSGQSLRVKQGGELTLSSFYPLFSIVEIRPMWETALWLYRFASYGSIRWPLEHPQLALLT